MNSENLTLTVASRKTPLAIAQVAEILNDLKNHYHYVEFSCTYIQTSGDKDSSIKDLKSPFPNIDKTDLFSKEIDEMVLFGVCRIAIHSAKDLPDPLPEGLILAALTQGLDSSDSLVLKPGQNLSTLPHRPIIAISSQRREDSVKMILPHAHFVNARGMIHQRLELLSHHTIDGVVIAEAALLRLDFSHLNRIQLPGPPTPLQGQLAVVVRTDDTEMLSLFSAIDCRQLVRVI